MNSQIEDIDNKYSFVDVAKEQKQMHEIRMNKQRELLLKIKKEKAKAF